MDTLKQQLFEATRYHRLQYKKHLGCNDFFERRVLTENDLKIFHVLYGIIERSDLEDEYLGWAEQQDRKEATE